MNLKHIRLIAATVATAVAIPFAASAADLTVAQGDSQTISADTTYGAVVVNGDLTVAPNVTLTCTSLTVADNINGTATLTIGDNAIVSVTGDSKTKIGVGAGRAEVYLGTGAQLRAENGFLNFCYGYDGKTSNKMTEALLVAGTNATIYCHTDFCFGHRYNSRDNRPNSASQDSVYAVVRLEQGSLITAQRIYDGLPVSEKIIFNGGQISQRKSANYTGCFINPDYSIRPTIMYFEGTNGCPIHLHLNDIGPMSGLYTSGGATGAHLYLTGNGGLLKTGAAVFPLLAGNSNPDGNDNGPNVGFQFTGDFVIREGGFSVANGFTRKLFLAGGYDIRPPDLVVENGASFDLAGCDIVMNSITAAGSGIITNSIEGTASATIGVRNDGRNSTLARVYPGIAFVKQGDTTLTLCGSEIDSLDIQGGTLVLKDRAHTGYPFCRVKFDRSGLDDDSTIDNAMRVREFAFFSNGQDVTRSYTNAYYDMSGTGWITSPELMFDGDPNTVYEDYRMHKAIDNEDRDKVQITLEYPECRAIDGYCWAPYNSSSFHYKLSPTAWRVFGWFSPTDANLLDQVTGFLVPGTTDDGWCTTNFVCTYSASPALHVGTFSLGNGAKVEATGAQVSCDTFSGSATGVKLDLSSGAALPLTASQSVSEISVDLTKDLATVAVLNPAASGKLYVTGDKALLRGDLLNVGSYVNGSNLHTWSVYLNGEDMHRTLCVEDGALRLTPLATMIYMR